jgi:hypothetical protein
VYLDQAELLCRGDGPVTAPHDPHNETQPNVFWLWIAVLGLAGLLFVATANRGIQWQDSGWQQWRVTTGSIWHPAGLALYHPLHFYLARFLVRLNFCEPAFAVTLLSSLSAAVALANVSVIVSVLTRSVSCAVVATIALGLSHTFWQHATHTETYALGVALLSGEWLCLTLYARRDQWRYLPLVALFNGLGIANHLLAALAAPVNVLVIVWAARKGRDARMLVLAAVAWVAGASLYGVFVVSEAIESGDLIAALTSALFGRYSEQVLNTSLDWRGLGLAVGYVVYNLPGLTIPLAVLGILRPSGTGLLLRRVLVAELLVYLVFVMRYSIADQYTFFTPVYAILAILGGLGLSSVQRLQSRRWRRAITTAAAVTACWTPIVYYATAMVLRDRGALSGLVGNRPYRDGYHSFFVPWGVGEDHAERLNRDLFTLVGEDGFVVLGAAMARFAIEYERFRGRGPQRLESVPLKDLKARHSEAEMRGLLASIMRARRVVVQAPYDRDHPAELVPGAVWERFGDLYVLRCLPEASSGSELEHPDE